MVQSKDSSSMIKENYQPSTYQGDAPAPLSKVKDELPWQRLAKQEQQIQEKFEEKMKISDEKREEGDGKGVGGLVGKASDIVSRVTNTVGHGLHQLTREAIEKIETLQTTRLRQRFPVDKDEMLLYEYSCIIFSGDTPCEGYLYITTDHVGFFSDSFCSNFAMKLWIPLEDVVSIQHGLALTKKDGKNVYIQLVQSEDVNTDAILVYTKDNEIHKFYKFGVVHDPISQSYFDHAWNVLDHAWRDSKEELKESKKVSNPWESKKAKKESQKGGHKKDSKEKDKDSQKDEHKNKETKDKDHHQEKDKDAKHKEEKDQDAKHKDTDSKEKGKDSKDKSPKEKDSKDKSPKEKDSKDKSPKEKDSKDKSPKEKDSKDKSPKEKGSKDKSPKQKDSKDKSPKDKGSKDKSPKEKDSKDKSLKEQESKDKSHKEKDDKDKDSKDKSPKDQDDKDKSSNDKDHQDISSKTSSAPFYPVTTGLGYPATSSSNTSGELAGVPPSSEAYHISGYGKP